jgi:rhodanese-related sulfurtransferase
MNRILQDRRNLVVTLAGGAALAWLAAGRSNVGRVEFQVPEVNVPQAKALLGAGAIAIDVRDQEKFAYRHLPNAVLIPLVVLRAGIPASLAAAKAQPIVVYCNRGLAHGPEATHLLRAAGFFQAANLASGIEGWADAGMPIKNG